MSEADQLVRQVYVEAARTCGDDVGAITRYVERRVAGMSEEQRRLFDRVSDRVLAFRAPAQPPERNH